MLAATELDRILCQPAKSAATSESELITKFGSQSNGDKAATQDRLGPKGLVVFLALLSAFVLAPAHAVYRNTHPLHEGRNFYRMVSEELTRQWHAQVGTPLTTVGGDDALTFALAFYSPDHPVYERRLVDPLPRPTPRKANLESGWAALCFDGDEYCAEAMQKIAERAPRIIRSEIVVRSSLFGQPGASDRFIAFIVPPSQTQPSSDKAPTTQTPGVAEDFSAIRRIHARSDWKALDYIR